MSAEKPFITSFFDGLCGALAVSHDLRIPGVPDRLFEDEPEDKQVIKADGENEERAGLQGLAEKS